MRNMEHWRIDNWQRKSEVPRENVPQLYILHHKFYMNWTQVIIVRNQCLISEAMARP
jgi:hypothetical protein